LPLPEPMARKMSEALALPSAPVLPALTATAAVLLYRVIELWIPAVLGIVVGTVGALAGSRLLAAFLFGVPATDAATFSAAISVFFCAAFVAAFVPALRSFRVDPASALRHE